MRHGNKLNHLGRKSAHRKAMISNMACSLIQHKRITTTVAKAKALRVFVEPLLTKAKTDSTHSRRVVFSYLQNKDIVSELFREIAPKIAERNGGYTRIIRTGFRLGDNAETCMIELVDFNTVYTKEETKKTTRRSRRGGGAKSTAPVEQTTDAIEEAVVVEETPIVDETPAMDETPAAEETQAAEEAPVVDETPAVEETQAAEETPVVDETPAVEETPAQHEHTSSPESEESSQESSENPEEPAK